MTELTLYYIPTCAKTQVLKDRAASLFADAQHAKVAGDLARFEALRRAGLLAQSEWATATRKYPDGQ